MRIHIALIFVLLMMSSACVSSSNQTDDNTNELETTESEAPAEEAQDDIEKALAEMGGPIEEMPADIVTTEPPVETIADEATNEPSLEPAEAVTQDDLSTPFATDEASATDAPQEVPSLELASTPEVPAERMPAETTASGEFAYMIHPGESLSAIAYRFYGAYRHWKELAAANNIKNANRITAGASLNIPITEKTQSAIDHYRATAKRSVTVKRGDTLASIASRVLGTPKAWKYLWKMNEDVVSNPNRIAVGMKLSYYGKKRAGVAKAKTAETSH